MLLPTPKAWPLLSRYLGSPEGSKLWAVPDTDTVDRQ